MSRISYQTCPSPIAPSIRHNTKQMPTPRYILCRCLDLSLTLSFYQPGTIARLSDDVLLNIFCHYVDTSPRYWPRLVHICRKWRRIVFACQEDLHLRLYCAPGTPVMKTLHCWPALPIVIEYGGSLSLELDSPAPADEVNIISALKQSHRVSSISLTLTTSLLDKLYAIKRPFLELEDLILLSRESMPLTLPSTFLWGPRLRRLRLTKIAFKFPALLQLLYSSTNLVDLQLHGAEGPWYFSMEELADALSGMAQLRSLSLRFPSTINYISPYPLSDRQIVLPALTRLHFRGISESMERLVRRIDAPRLWDIKITLFDVLFLDLSRLGKFIDRTGKHNSHHQACILSSDRAISISLTQPGTPTCLKLQLLCEPLSEQLLSALLRILLNFSALFLRVEDLRISAILRPSPADDGQWLKLLNSFTGIKWLHLDGYWSTDIIGAIQNADSRGQTVLAALHKLYLPHTGLRHAPLSEATVTFMTSRWRSGHPIGVEYERLRHTGIGRRGPGTSLCTVPLPLPPNLSETGRFSRSVAIYHGMFCKLAANQPYHFSVGPVPPYSAHD
jgi:hypothetical protein